MASGDGVGEGDVAAEAARLARRREETVRQVASLTRDFDEIVEGSELVNTDDEHDPEGATIAFERAQVLALLASARERLAALDAARERLAAGRYGTCAACGRPIPPERLDAVPDTTRCVACADAASLTSLRAR